LTTDYEHRLIGVGTAAAYSYDGIGNRLAATRNNVTTRYVYDLHGNLIAEADVANTITRYYIHGLGLMSLVTPAGQTYCYHFNQIGSTVAMTDMTPAMVNQYAYTPFGTIANQTETIAQPFTFVGQMGVMTEPNGFYYMRARYYDPAVRRFISEDPIGFEGGDLNLYAYVGNNPAMLVDPGGNLAFFWHFWITLVAALNSDNPNYNSLGSALKLAWNTMGEDGSAFSHEPNQTRVHAMGGRLPNGEYQTRSEAIVAATAYINDISNSSSGRTHATQDQPVHAGESMETYSFFSMHTVRDVTGGGTIGQAYQNTLNLLNGGPLK
jgi:RHS repeat-associated protein